MTETEPPIKICVIGAGLAGSMVASLLGRLNNIEISIFEKREDFTSDNEKIESAQCFGTTLSALKRSINLALSYRGICALEEIGILDEIMKNAIEMPCRIIHQVTGEVVKQAYGKPGEAIWSVGRQTLNLKLLNILKSMGNVRMYFNYALIDARKDGKCSFRRLDVSVHEETYDLIIGADGAYSTCRECQLRQGRINFSREYISHGYKELTIPPFYTEKNGLEYALADHHGLHIWPRGDFMLIALPNPDKSFTATLFAPYSGPDGFDSVNASDADEVTAYFKRHFPDVLPLMTTIDDDFKDNPIGSLVTVKVKPWNLGRIVLIGDAAHAVVPFYGQGMNAAFEDGHILYSMIKQEMEKNRGPLDFPQLAANFSSTRQPATDVLSQLCVEHYEDMASSTSSTCYLLKKKAEAKIFSLLSKHYFTPLYSMIAFSTTPYDKALIKSKKQDQAIERIFWGSLAVIGVGLLGSIPLLFKSNKKFF